MEPQRFVASQNVWFTTMFAVKISATYARLWTGSWFVLAWLETATIRTLLVLKARHWAAQGRFVRNLAIVGFNEVAERLIERLLSDDNNRIIGCFDERVRRDPPIVSPRRIERLVTPTDLIEYARRNRVDHIIIAFPWSATERIISVARQLGVPPIDISLAPDKHIVIGIRFLTAFTLAKDSNCSAFWTFERDRGKE